MGSCSFGGLILQRPRGARVRYRLHLHKAIVFPLSWTCLPRTWRGCHSELRDSPQSCLASAADQYSSIYPSLFPAAFFLLPLFFSALLRASLQQASERASERASEQASSYTLSTLPCLHSCILLHGAALYAFRFAHS